MSDRVVTVPPASASYVRELDGIRAVAVAIVVFAHYRLLPRVPGGFGVTLFFFLSGYLITTLFFSEYGARQNISIPLFYLRRWLRLTPPLLISVIFGVIFYGVTRNAVGGHAVPIGTTVAALLYYTNYYDLAWAMDPDKVIPFGICWSLAIEEHFYLAWPWIIRATIRSPNRLCIIILSLCTIVLAWRLVARYELLLPPEHTYMATDCRIDSILYGALLRSLFQTRWAIIAVRILQTMGCRAIAVSALLATFLIRDDNFRETFRYSIQGIALMPVFTAILVDDQMAWTRRALSNAPMVLIGRLSYSIYLFHLLARTPGEVYFGSPYALGATVSGLLLTGVIAYALYIFVERPVARFRHRFSDQAARPKAAASSSFQACERAAP